MTEKKALLEAAHEFAGEGIPIFPLYGKYRLPAPDSHGHLDATTNAQQIDTWANTPITGLGTPWAIYFAIDLDIKHGEQPLDELKRYAADKGGYDYRDCAVVKTPSGGEHHIYSGHYAVSKNGVLPGVDLKCIDGWTRVPPTAGYTWETDKPWEIDPPSVPDWIPDLAALSKKQGAADFDDIQEGNRNDSLASYLGAQRRYGMDADTLYTLALGWNERIADALGDDELRQVVRSIAGYTPEVDLAEPPADDDDGVQRIFTANEIMELELPIPRILIGPLDEYSQTWLIAPKSTGKTFFGHGIAHALSNGQPMGDWVCTAKGKVTVVDGEMPPHSIKRVLETVGGGDYRIIANCFRDDPFNLMQPTHQDWLLDQLRGDDLVIFDNVFSLFPTTVDLTSTGAEYAQALNAFLQRLRGEYIASLLFDHPGKLGGAFGSSRLMLRADNIGVMSREVGEGHVEGKAGFYLSFKNEDGGRVRGEFKSTYHGSNKWILDGHWRVYN
jgi:hypothetical protein